MIDAERLYFPTLNTFTTYLPLCIHQDIICLVSEVAIWGTIQFVSIGINRIVFQFVSWTNHHLISWLIFMCVRILSCVSMFHVRVRINMWYIVPSPIYREEAGDAAPQRESHSLTIFKFHFFNGKWNQKQPSTQSHHRFQYRLSYNRRRHHQSCVSSSTTPS